MKPGSCLPIPHFLHSEIAHPVSKKLITISEDKVEEQAGFGLEFDGRKSSVENCDSTLSLRSVRSEDSGDAHPVSNNLAAISENGIDKQAEFGL